MVIRQRKLKIKILFKHIGGYIRQVVLVKWEVIYYWHQILSGGILNF